MRSILEVGSEQLPLLFYRCQINKVTYKYLLLLKHPNAPCICKKAGHSAPGLPFPARRITLIPALIFSYIILYFGSLKELFSDTIRLNTSASGVESFASTQKIALSYKLEAVICLRTLQEPGST